MKHTLRILLALLLMLALCVPALAFNDTGELSDSEQEALAALSGLGVIGGYPDGSFRPDATITRAEFAKMLGIFAGATELMAEENLFADVAPGSWYFGWVCRAAEQGWIRGYPGGEFRPQNSITQQEIAAVLVRLSGTNTTNFVWPGDYNTAAENAGILHDIAFAGAGEASRIIACQMFFNALTQKQEQEQPPLDTAQVRGIITQLGGGSLTLKNIKNAETTYAVKDNLLPDKLIPGSYVELTVAEGSVVTVTDSILAKKGAAYFDVALDGKSAVIDGKKYDIAEVDIFAVNYTLNKPYSTGTFTGGGAIDRDILSLGGRLAAEMAVLMTAEDGALKGIYLVNASVVITGGRVDVVEGAFSSIKGAGAYFLGRETGLPLASGVTMPNSGDLIHYSLKNGEISGWSLLYTPGMQTLPNVAQILSSSYDDAPYAWVGANGRADTGPVSALPLVVSVGSGRRTLQLGIDESNCINYWLAEGCLIYEVKNDKISQGDRDSIEKGRQVIALVNSSGDVCYLLCLMD